MPPNDSGPRPASVTRQGLLLASDGSAEPCERIVAVETPVQIVYGSIPFAVMMTSPRDLEDFACGFSYTEGVIDAADDIRAIAIADVDHGVRIDITLRPENLQRHLGRSRALAGRTGCGVCGVTDLAFVAAPAPGGIDGAAVEFAAIARALEAAESLQMLNRDTRAVHGAAFCRRDGSIVAIREDVGRHNALDKLIGAMLRQGVDAREGFVLITSRASYEMVEKTARFGAPALAAMSAPTSLAIERAQAHGLTLVAIARRDGAIAFTMHGQDGKDGDRRGRGSGRGAG